MTTGVWKGNFAQDGTHYPFEIELTFSAGSVYGNGTDEIGDFSIGGTYDKKTVQFMKQYTGKHTVTYAGEFKPDGRSMIGTYKVGGAEGAFMMSCC